MFVLSKREFIEHGVTDHKTGSLLERVEYKIKHLERICLSIRSAEYYGGKQDFELSGSGESQRLNKALSDIERGGWNKHSIYDF